MKARLKEEMLQHRINRDAGKSKVLALILGEAESEEKRTGNPVADDWLIAKIRKIIQANNECMAQRVSVGLVEENDYLESLLPKQLTEEELRGIIGGVAANHIGEVMQYLKANYAGLYDGKMASKIAKEKF